MQIMTEDLIHRMHAEDRWLQNGDFFGILLFSQSCRKNHVELEATIEMLETAKNDFSDSPVLHAALSIHYSKLPEELSHQEKGEMGMRELSRQGKLHILSYRGKTVEEMWSSLPSKGEDVLERFDLAGDVMKLMAYDRYMGKSNAERAFVNLLKSLELSEGKPAVFEHIIHPLVLPYLPEMVDATLNFNRGRKPAMGIENANTLYLCDVYKRVARSNKA